jgi:flagellar biosynthesis protein FlhB
MGTLVYILGMVVVVILFAVFFNTVGMALDKVLKLKSKLLVKMNVYQVVIYQIVLGWVATLCTFLSVVVFIMFYQVISLLYATIG